MGIYAQTNFRVECKNMKTAKHVKTVLEVMPDDEYGNDFAKRVEVDGNADGATVYAFLNSGRVQNLTYKCESIWEHIKDISGVFEMDCPFLVEGDGEYFTNDND